MSSENSWHAFIEAGEPLAQGELIPNCPVIIPPKIFTEEGHARVKIEEYDVIIMTQSCDIENDKIKYLIVCPVYPLSTLEKNPFFKNPVGKEILRRGNINNLFLLNQCQFQTEQSEFLVVNFKNIFSVYKQVLETLVVSQETRLRLLSPYREHLSQAFARYFMRVGLPEDIPKFANQIYKLES